LSPGDASAAAETGARKRLGIGVAALRHRDFQFFAIVSFLSTNATLMQAVALGWQVYDLTGSALNLGLIGLAEFLPALLLALITGHVADRFDRRIVCFLCYLLELVCAGLLVLFAVAGVASVWPYLAVALLFGIARAFVAPASRALPPTLVPDVDFPNAIVWGSILWDAAVIAGPLLGGYLYILGPQTVYGIAGAGFALSALLMLAIRPGPARLSSEPVSWGSVAAGIQLIRRTPVLLGAISLDLFAVLFGGATALLPVFAKDILQVGTEGLGHLRAAPAVGAVTMALVLAVWPIHRKVGRSMFACVAAFGAATVVFGLSTSFWLSLAALFVVGAADMVSVFIRVAIVPAVTPDNLRGRVLAVEQIFIGASNELGAFESGAVAALIGAVPTVVLGGLATLLIVALWLKLFPALRDVDRFPVAPS